MDKCNQYEEGTGSYLACQGQVEREAQIATQVSLAIFGVALLIVLTFLVKVMKDRA